MTQEELIRLMSELRALPSETEWVEFKCNYVEPEEIGINLMCLFCNRLVVNSNMALLSAIMPFRINGQLGIL